MNSGWQLRKLGDVCERVTVGHVGITSPHYRDNGILFLRTQNVGKSGLNLVDVKYITHDFHKELKKSQVKSGDVLMSRVITNEINCALIPPNLGPANCANVVLVRPSPQLLPEYLVYYIQSPEAQRQLLDKRVGSAQLVVNTTVVKTWPIPVPPVNEQRRIVNTLDGAFGSIAAAKANTEKNLQNARALFEAHLHAALTRRSIEWMEKPLADVVHATCSLSYGIVQPGEEYPDGLPVVRPTDLTRKVIQATGLKRIDPALAASYRRTTLVGGELLLCVRGSTGMVSIASDELAGANVTRGIVPIRFDPSSITPEFGYYLLASENIQAQIRKKTYGAALMQINIRDLRGISLQFPNLKAQRFIAKNLDALAAETQRLEALYQRKLAALDELKKSLLRKAFTGEL